MPTADQTYTIDAAPAGLIIGGVSVSEGAAASAEDRANLLGRSVAAAVEPSAPVDEETVRAAAGEVADLLTAAGLALTSNPS